MYNDVFDDEEKPESNAAMLVFDIEEVLKNAHTINIIFDEDEDDDIPFEDCE